MNSLRTLAITVFVLMSVSASQAQTSQEDQIFNQLEKHTLKLYESVQGNPFAFGQVCTAVLIEKQENMSMLFTAGHCVEDKDRSYMVLSDKPYFVIKKYVSKYSDLAVLFVSGSIADKDPAPITESRLSIGDKLFNFAYPGTIVFKKTGGFVNEDWIAGSVSFIVIPGCSGSGVFNVKGQLEGIAVSYNRDEPVSYYVPIFEYMRFFHQLQVDGELPAVDSGVG